MKHTFPLVVYATGYPLHADAIRGYLKGFYTVVTVRHSLWQDGLAALQAYITQAAPVAVLVDSTFALSPLVVAQQLQARQTQVKLAFIDSQPNIFKVLHCLDNGYAAYLHFGDELATQLKTVIDAIHRGERYLSPTILGLYERYKLYRGLFDTLPKALDHILRLMGEGLNVQDIAERTGLQPTVIYRRQYRLRQHFGADTNAELIQILEEMFHDHSLATFISEAPH